MQQSVAESTPIHLNVEPNDSGHQVTIMTQGHHPLRVMKHPVMRHVLQAAKTGKVKRLATVADLLDPKNGEKMRQLAVELGGTKILRPTIAHGPMPDGSRLTFKTKRTGN